MTQFDISRLLKEREGLIQLFNQTTYIFTWIIYLWLKVCIIYLSIQWSLCFTTLYFTTTLDYKTTWFGPKVPFCVLEDLYFKTTCNIWPHFLRPMGSLKIEVPLYCLLNPLFAVGTQMSAQHTTFPAVSGHINNNLHKKYHDNYNKDW